jgi:hypothetical protein
MVAFRRGAGFAALSARVSIVPRASTGLPVVIVLLS